MIVDPSAILAIIYAEPEAETFLTLMNDDQPCLLSSPSYVELSIVLGTRHGEEGLENLNLLLTELSITVVPFTPKQAQLGAKAFLEFGKGRHPAKLNMGDCFSYALAKAMGHPLLFKGNDFAQTDIETLQF